MELTRDERLALFQALCKSFPGHEDLDVLVSMFLGKNPAEVAPGSQLSARVAKLIENAESDWFLVQLLTEAPKANPGDEKLKQLSSVILPRLRGELGLADSDLPASALERVIHAAKGFMNPALLVEHLPKIITQVCRVEYPAGTHIGTGFLLGPDVVMTNYHVMKSVIDGLVDPNEVVLRFDYIEMADGSVKDGALFHLAEDWKIAWSRYSEADDNPQLGGLPEPDQLDYTLLRVADAPGSSRGWIPMPGKKHAFVPGAYMLIIGYPALSGDEDVLKYSIDSVTGLNENRTRVRYKTNTEGGSSGSPCFNADLELVALHQAMGPDSSCNQGIPFSEILDQLREQDWAKELGE